jgi:hypothetical protein
MIQGKEAFISMGPDKFEVKRVPAIDAIDNLISDSLSIELSNNVLVGKGKYSLHGLSKGNVGYQFDKIEDQLVRENVSRIVNKGSNKFFLDSYTLNNVSAGTKPTEIEYAFRLSDYCQITGDEIYLNLNLNKDNYNRFVNTETRKTPHEFDFKYHKRELIEFRIPDDYDVEYLPLNEASDGSLIGYSISYERKGNLIRYRKDYYVNYLLLTPSQFHTWNDEVAKLSNAYRETIILKKKKQ